ncbi:protein TonB [Dysgonomonas alginatilytica]|uniref:Protein TonB n=1 Tax=Dysgonomonas alginatilytica TaxID=1605892 RepID=A0A2V3PQY1_9BACT|nr:energy transducer TonB [Dysgonomonas alginatilytica]PXV64366.1 protein TonB [Dysgonomonas alginatilytica]
MARNIQLNSSDWCDIVFAGKNKSYGAYTLRQGSSKRHILAFGVMVLFVGAVAALPSFLEAVKANSSIVKGIDDEFILSTIAKVEEQIPEEKLILQEIAPPKPILKSTIAFTPPAIVSVVDPEKEMKAIGTLLDSPAPISKATIEGSNAPGAVDIADVKEHTAIIEGPVKQDKPFLSVEQMPQFPGGDAELMRFIGSNLKYPTISVENGIEGRVIIRFVIGKDGRVSDVEIVRTLDPACDKEAMRVVKMMPKWVAGMQNGRNVSVYYTLPVLFKLQR